MKVIPDARVAFTKFDIYVFTKARKPISCHADIPTESFLDDGRHFSVVLYRLDVFDVRLYKQMDPSGVVFGSPLCISHCRRWNIIIL